jgi:hypothetical protein
MTETVVFTPIDFDIETLPPDAPAGAWQVLLTTKIAKTAKDSFPMIIIDAILEQAYDDENEQFANGETRVSTFLCFFPEGHKASKMGKINVRAVCDKLGIARSLIPTHIATSADLEEFATAIDGQKCDAWTAIETSKDKQSGEMVTRSVLKWKAPGSTASALPPLAADDGDDAEDEVEEEEEVEEVDPVVVAKANAAAKSKNGAKAGKSARR